MAVNFAVLGPIWPNFELVRDVIYVLYICKYEEDPIKNEKLECSQDFSHYNPMGAICCHGKPEFQSDLAQNLMQPFPYPNDASVKI